MSIALYTLPWVLEYAFKQSNCNDNVSSLSIKLKLMSDLFVH